MLQIWPGYISHPHMGALHVNYWRKYMPWFSMTNQSEPMMYTFPVRPTLLPNSFYPQLVFPHFLLCTLLTDGVQVSLANEINDLLSESLAIPTDIFNTVLHYFQSRYLIICSLVRYYQYIPAGLCAAILKIINQDTQSSDIWDILVPPEMNGNIFRPNPYL